MTERVGCGVAVILWKKVDGIYQCLMHRRHGAHGSGTHSFIGGWMEKGESFLDAVRREAREEADLHVETIRHMDIMSTVFPDDDKHSVTILFESFVWSGTPKPLEKDKICGDWFFVDPKKMPEPLFKPLTESSYIAHLKKYGMDSDWITSE